jgi:hypothetical protein
MLARERRELSLPRELDRPIFILGPHRSGTTLFYEILARHDDLAFLNRTNHKLPDWVRLAWALTRLGAPHFPHEGQRFWDRFWDGSDDVMTAADATPPVVEWYRTRIRRVVDTRRSDRFLAKYPRLSLRLSWLDEIFPGSVFLHVVRDWRAVVSSTALRKLERSHRGGGWFGVRIPGWRRMQDLSHEVAAARQYAYVTRYLEEHGPAYGDRYVRVRYEDLCRAPVRTVRRLASRLGLPLDEEFSETLPRALTSANHKWPALLSPEVIARIRDEDPRFFDEHTEHERAVDLVGAAG